LPQNAGGQGGVELAKAGLKSGTRKS